MARVRTEAYFYRGLLEARSTLFLTVRLGVRLNQLIPRFGAAGPGAGLWRVALPAFVVVDIVVWRRLRRDAAYGLRWRLPLDMFDVAFWSLSPLPPSERYDWAILAAMPLSVEAGFRNGIRGLNVAAAAAIVCAVVRSAAGKPLFLTHVGWLAVGVAMGMALYRYSDRLFAQATEAHKRRLIAESRRMYLAGQNAVAMGASSAVDLIEGLVPILGPPPEGSALWRMANGWKQGLSEATREEASYLQVVALEWEKVHNRHPDLNALVFIHVREGDGTTLLTAAQASYLCGALDQLQLRGDVSFRVGGDQGANRLGSSIDLRIGSRRVQIPADPGSRPALIDPGPITYLFIAILLALGHYPSFGGSPWQMVVAGVAVTASAGVWSHRVLARRGASGRARVFLGAAIVGLLLAGLFTATQTARIGTDGDPIYPHGIEALLVSFIGGVYARDLRRFAWAVPAAFVGVHLVGLALTPSPTFRSFVASAIWNATPYFPCRRVSQTVERAGDAYIAAAREDDMAASEQAFQAGKDSVLVLVQEAEHDAAAQLARVASDLDPRLVALARRRLDEVSTRLSV